MHENNFEDEVRKKMEQLGFDPPDAVWTAVDKEINKEKKRHRPLFILFLFSGLLIAGGAIYVGTQINYSDKKTIPLDQMTKEDDQNKSSVSKDQSARVQENKLDEKTIIPGDQKKGSLLKGNPNSKATMVKPGNTVTSSNGSKEFVDKRNSNEVDNTGTTDNGKSNLKNIPPVLVKTESENSGVNRVDTASVKKMIAAVAQKSTPKDSIVESNLASNDKSKGKIKFWKIGFTGGAGVSNTNQSLFKQGNVTGLYYSASNINVNGASAYPVPVSSEINPGFSYTAGVFVSRYLSKRISISAGFNYHYYSTHNKTGYKVDSSILVYNPPYFNWGTGVVPGPSSINGYYQSGTSHSYTNQYHFIELPVTADFQLNKSIKLPVYWEAGLSVSYLFSSNALHFDPNGNLYYQNAELFNKVQLNGATAVMIGFTMNKNELLLGPQLQYGLSGLLKSGSGNPQHLIYTGLKISFIPGNK